VTSFISMETTTDVVVFARSKARMSGAPAYTKGTGLPTGTVAFDATPASRPQLWSHPPV